MSGLGPLGPTCDKKIRYLDRAEAGRSCAEERDRSRSDAGVGGYS
jgi:hypothetical protein